MFELSLHILDLIENAIRAGAKCISVTVSENPALDKMEIIVEDDGPGFNVQDELLLDPFFTTKRGKHVGLGLSLFRAAAEQAGGGLTIGTSRMGGAWVKVEMKLTSVDRMPLGDLASTISSVVCTNPGVDLWCCLRLGDNECNIRASDIALELSPEQRRGLEVARRVSAKIKNSIMAMGVLD